MPREIDLIPDTTPLLREPVAEDGAEIWKLVQSCKPLDENSMYCNLIQCDHFKETCVIAELDKKIVGWVSAYILPNEPDTLFVWQVAVSEAARGLGLGTRMLTHLMRRDSCADVVRLQTTITSDNKASWALFRKFGKTFDAELSDEPYFRKDQHFGQQHSTEYMLTIDFAERMRAVA